MNRTERSMPVSRQLGFTLVELMVVVLIVGILTTFAVPGYRNHVVKTQRAAAKACLAQYAQMVERYYTTRLTYENVDDAADGISDPGCASEGNMAENYAFNFVGTPDAVSYVIAAEQTGEFAARDKQCGDLTLNQRGERGVSRGNAADCW